MDEKTEKLLIWVGLALVAFLVYRKFFARRLVARSTPTGQNVNVPQQGYNPYTTPPVQNTPAPSGGGGGNNIAGLIGASVGALGSLVNIGTGLANQFGGSGGSSSGDTYAGDAGNYSGGYDQGGYGLSGDSYELGGGSSDLSPYDYGSGM